MTEAELKKALAGIIKANKRLVAHVDAMYEGFMSSAITGQQLMYRRALELLAAAPTMSELEFSRRLSWYLGNSSAIEEIVRGSGIIEASRAYVAAYEKLAALTAECVKAGAVGAALVTIPAEYVQYLMSRDGAYFIDILTPEAIRKLDDVLFEMSVGGFSRGAMLDELRGVITGSYAWGDRRGLYEWHAGTYARTAASRTAQGYMNVGAEQAGLSKYIYVGPVDEKMREFCADVIGGVYTLEEIRELDNGQTGDVYTDRGGWNCRHNWNPVSDEFAAAVWSISGGKVEILVEEAA